MLKKLFIKNYVLMDSLEIEFPKGLIIITGQTGSGKSVLLSALSLILGGKYSGDLASVLLRKDENCILEAVFDISDDKDLKDYLHSEDIEMENSDLIIRRIIYPSSRSRSFINDCPSSLEQVKEISTKVLDIHSQGDNLLLSDRKFQLKILDLYAKNQKLLSECLGQWTDLQKLRAEISTLKEDLENAGKELDYNDYVIKTLSAANLKDSEELEKLEERHKCLANSEEIKYQLQNALRQFEPENASSIDRALKEAVKSLQKISTYIDTEELIQRLDSLRIDLADAHAEIESLDERVEHSPEELEKLEERINFIYSLFKQFRLTTISELMDLLKDKLGAEDRIIEFKEKLDSIQQQEKLLSQKLMENALKLRESRKKAAKSFSKELLDSLKFLELEHAKFDIQFTDKDLSATGIDEICFKFSANEQELRELAYCASGGEKSRIMLALKALMARISKLPAMVFDEIDTGVSGSVADKMGTMLSRMGEYMQIFAISHLAQVASKGKSHYLVSKSMTADNKVSAKIELLSEDERLNEIARILSGSEISPEALKNAKALLSKST